MKSFGAVHVLALLLLALQSDAVAAEDGQDPVSAGKSNMTRTSRRSFLRLAVYGGLAYAGLQSRQWWEAGPQVMDFPIVQMQGGAYAEIDAGDTAILRILIDSGASRSIITNEAAELAGLPAFAPEATLVSRSYPKLALRMGVVSSRKLPKGVAGILGLDQMRRYMAVEIDWEGRRLRLHTTGWEQGALEAVSMPMQMRETGVSALPFVPVSFADGKGTVVGGSGLVDTGSPVTEVTPQLAGMANMVRKYKYAERARAIARVRESGLSADQWTRAAMSDPYGPMHIAIRERARRRAAAGLEAYASPQTLPSTAIPSSPHHRFPQTTPIRASSSRECSGRPQSCWRLAAPC